MATVDWEDKVKRLRNAVARTCSAIGCPKSLGAKEDFCLKHFSMLSRDTRTSLMRGSPELKARALSHAQEIIQKRESRGMDA